MSRKKMILTVAAAALCCLFASACMPEYEPLYYQQIYNLQGIRTDAYKLYDKGEAVAVPEHFKFRTELQKLYAKYPEVIKGVKTDTYRLGWFFRQQKLERSMGEAIGDQCNHAAWFVLNCIPEKDQKKYAQRIAKLMLEFDEENAGKLLGELYQTAIPGGMIQQHVKYLDDKEESGMVIASTEYFTGRLNGIAAPRFGLSRTYYPTGMLRSEVFYKNNEPVGLAFYYGPDGRLLYVVEEQIK